MRIYHPADYMTIEYRPEEQLIVSEDERLAVARSLDSGPAYTIMCPEGILACSGVQAVHSGVGVAWTVTSPLVLKYPKAFHQIVKRYMRCIIQSMKYHRVHSIVDSRFSDSVRWVPRLGLKYEATLSCYGPSGQDFKIFAWVQEVDGDY